MSDLVLGEYDVPVVPVWGDGSMTAMCWASQQRCPSALAKLILLRLADYTGAAARSAFYAADMGNWCCAPPEDVNEAVAALGAKGLLKVLVNERLIDAALPWWREERQPKPVKAVLRKMLWEEQGGCCWYCGCEISCDHLKVQADDGSWVDPAGKAPYQIEHQHPRARGGGDAIENLVLACTPCNRTKSDRTVDEYRAYLASRVGAAVVFHGERP